MTLQDFINRYNGKGVDFDGAYGYQCMDLMHRYIVDVCGLSGSVLAAPTAFYAWRTGDSHFDRVTNPRPGDIAFWNDTVGPAGHVAIFVSGSATNFTSLDQNWPVGSTTHLQTHTGNGVAGYLRLKGSNNQGGTMETAARIQDLQKIGLMFEGIDPDSGFDYSGWVGQPLQKVIEDWWAYPNTQAYIVKVRAALQSNTPTNVTTLKPGYYKVN